MHIGFFDIVALLFVPALLYIGVSIWRMRKVIAKDPTRRSMWEGNKLKNLALFLFTGFIGVLFLYLGIKGLLTQDLLSLREMCSYRYGCFTAYNLSWHSFATLTGMTMTFLHLFFWWHLIRGLKSLQLPKV